MKNRFGDGYSLEIHSAHEYIEQIQSYISEQFTGAELQEMHFGHLKYQLPKSNCSLGDVFASLELKKQEFGIRDYAVSQTSLESIFVRCVIYKSESSIIKHLH